MTAFVSEKDKLHRDNLIWLLIAQAFSILPLLFYLPIWLVFFWILAILWRVQIHRMKWTYPNVYGKLLLGTFCVVAVYFSFQGIKSVEPMVAFLVCSFVLKTVELRSKKDALTILFIGFIAIACQFLFASNLFAGIYGVFSLFILLSAWQAAFFSQGLSIHSCLKGGGLLVLQSAPFMVVLFVIMPRIGPLWSVPIPEGHGKTGFSESLKLGDIGNLVRTPETAFRVSFSSAKPMLNQLYWRGLILDDFDGVEWRAHSYLPNSVIPSLTSVKDLSLGKGDNLYKYSVVLEPHSYPWLFTLNKPIAADSSHLKLFVNDEGILASRKPISQKSEYSVVSQLMSPHSFLSKVKFDQLTALPARGNERARGLALKWKQRYQSPSEIVQAAFRYYTSEFSYTLQPTLLTDNAIDQFLFDSKNGFCEHFASSFVYLMRSAGIPSRIVVGYQGGEYNDVDKYFVVKQSDAHAWAEVWLNDQWQMVDPTTAVAPSRVSLGIEQSLGESDLAYLEKSIWKSRMLRNVYQRWDALGFAWNKWVLNYDQDNQEGVFRKLLGSASPWRVGLAFLSICSLIFSIYIVLQYSLKIKKVTSKENILMRPILNKLSKLGFVREPSESMVEFSERAVKSGLSHDLGFTQIAKAYTNSVYNPDAHSYDRLKEVIAKNHK